MNQRHHSRRSKLTIWDIPRLSTSELQKLVETVPYEIVALSILDVTAEIRNKIYSVVTPEKKTKLQSNYTSQYPLVQDTKGMLKEVLHAQEKLAESMNKLF